MIAKLKTPILYLSAFFYVAVGVYHFVNPDFFLAIMPPYLPLHLELVYLSGFFEILLSVLLCVPMARNWREGASPIFWLPPKTANLLELHLPKLGKLAVWSSLPSQINWSSFTRGLAKNGASRSS